MRHYYVYLLKPEVVTSYFGKEWLIFQLFLEGETSSGELKEIVDKQIKYISSTLPSLQVRKTVEQTLKHCNDFQVLNQHYYLELKSSQSKAVLKDHGNVITISATGSYQAETVFFEVLRKVNNCFFAIDFQNKNHGWLSPVKQVNYI